MENTELHGSPPKLGDLRVLRGGALIDTHSRKSIAE